MSMFTDFRRFVVRQRELRAQYRAAMYLEYLPTDIQKDLGWPDSEGFLSLRRNSDHSATQTP